MSHENRNVIKMSFKSGECSILEEPVITIHLKQLTFEFQTNK